VTGAGAGDEAPRRASDSPIGRNAVRVPPVATGAVAARSPGGPGARSGGLDFHHENGHGQPRPGLIERLRLGEAAALEELYGLLGSRVYRVARGLLPQDSDAEDATQEVFLKVYERAGQFDGRARFTTWLHRLTVNHCLHRIERERLRRAEPLEGGPRESLADGGPGPGEESARNDDQRRIDALLERVPPHQRAALVLREVEGLSYAEIAAVLEVPVGTVMSRLARARERLVALVRPSTRGERALPRPRNTP